MIFSRNASRFALPVAAALFSGCAGTLAINPHYRPGPLASSYDGPKPKIYLASITNKSSGIAFDGSAAIRPGVSIKRPLEQCLQEALISAFGRLGFPVVKNARDADAQISASWSDTIVTLDGGFSVVDKAAIRIGLVVKGRNKSHIYNGEVFGRGVGTYSHAGCCPGIGPGQAVEAALANAMNRLEDLFMNELTDQIFATPAAAAAAAAPALPAAARSAPETIIYSDIDEVPEAKPARRKAHALVIGIERYREQLPSADFAAGDAKLVGKYLTNSLGYPPENLVVLTNESAARSDLEKYLERWLPNRVAAGDAVFVYYSGHGSPNPTTGDAYLVPYDGDPTYLEQTAYPVQRLYGALAKLPTKDVTVVLDSCFSGAGGRSVLAKGARPLVTVSAKADIPESMTVMAAAAGNQISQSYQEKGHGLFTYFFLKGLGQQAGKSAVDMRKIFDFASTEVSRVARQQYNSEQVPQWHGGKQ